MNNNWNVILDGLTLFLLALGGFALYLLKKATEAAVKTSAEEAARATIQQLQWPAELARELQKTRGVERQELRFKSYGGLWKELRPLAIYDATAINKTVVEDLSRKLSDWYFSEQGGLLLTPQARYFYFALQDLLRAASRTPEEWVADRSVQSEDAQKNTFRALLEAGGASQAIGESIVVFDYFSKGTFEDWQTTAPDYGKKWRSGINAIAAAWGGLDNRQRFATLQQAGSILRTSLTNDLESRIR